MESPFEQISCCFPLSLSVGGFFALVSFQAWRAPLAVYCTFIPEVGNMLHVVSRSQFPSSRYHGIFFLFFFFFFFFFLFFFSSFLLFFTPCGLCGWCMLYCAHSRIPPTHFLVEPLVMQDAGVCAKFQLSLAKWGDASALVSLLFHFCDPVYPNQLLVSSCLDWLWLLIRFIPLYIAICYTAALSLRAL